MKITLESRSEIRRIYELLESIYPAEIILDTDDLLDIASGNTDRELPWNSDSCHPGPLMRIAFPEDELVDKPVDKRTCKEVDKVVDKKDDNEQLYTHSQVFSQGAVWEEVVKDGKKYLRRVIDGTTPFQKEEDMIYLSGQLDAWFQLVNAGCNTMADVAKITGQLEPFLVDLCRIWNRRMCGKGWGQKWFKVHPDGSYTINDDPDD